MTAPSRAHQFQRHEVRADHGVRLGLAQKAQELERVEPVEGRSDPLFPGFLAGLVGARVHVAPEFRGGPHDVQITLPHRSFGIPAP